MLQYTRFAYTDQATRRRIGNAATPKPGAFNMEWTELSLPPMRMRGRAELPEASLILNSVKQCETELIADCHGETEVNLVTALGFYSMFGSLESLLKLA